MNENNLKEQRRHGDELMPITSYEYYAPYGINPMYTHWHSEMELFLLCEGKLNVRCGENSYICEKGSLLFFNSGELHSAEKLSDEDVRFRSIVFHPDMLCEADLIRAKYIKPLLDGQMIFPVEIPQSLNVHECFDRLFDTLSEKSFGYELKVKEILFNIFYILVENSARSEGKGKNPAEAAIKKAVDFINENYAHPLSTDKLADMVNMSAGHFCRSFKSVTMKTPVQYINNIRTAKAAEMLISTNEQILNISLDTGFNSVSYFIAVFRENMGMTPSRFRKEYRKSL